MRRPYPHVYPSIIGRDDLERDRIRDAVATVIFGMSHWVRNNAGDIVQGKAAINALADAMVDAFMESVPDGDKMATPRKTVPESEHQS